MSDFICFSLYNYTMWRKICGICLFVFVEIEWKCCCWWSQVRCDSERCGDLCLCSESFWEFTQSSDCIACFEAPKFAWQSQECPIKLGCTIWNARLQIGIGKHWRNGPSKKETRCSPLVMILLVDCHTSVSPEPLAMEPQNGLRWDYSLSIAGNHALGKRWGPCCVKCKMEIEVLKRTSWYVREDRIGVLCSLSLSFSLNNYWLIDG